MNRFFQLNYIYVLFISWDELLIIKFNHMGSKESKQKDLNNVCVT